MAKDIPCLEHLIALPIFSVIIEILLKKDDKNNWEIYFFVVCCFETVCFSLLYNKVALNG